MAWIEKLYATYEACKGHEPQGAQPLMPISHTPQQIHIEITIDEHGSFKGAKTTQKEETFIPATEKSANRTAGEAAHSLCDKVQYCAADYVKHGGTKPPYFASYEKLLSEWCDSDFSHAKARAVLAYVQKAQVVADLVREKILYLGEDGKLLTKWPAETDTPDVFRLLTAKDGERDQGDAFIRWQVQCTNDPNSAVWLDTSLQQAWIDFESSSKATKGLCMVTGEENTALALSHPKRIRHAGDGAKIVSANDKQGYTFRGRFTDQDGQQACGVSSEVTQKAHSALRWLINRQSYHDKATGQVFVTWAVAGKPVPDPFQDTLSLILGIEVPELSADAVPQTLSGDAGQAFALRLKSAIAGYRAKLDPTDDIVIMGLDSATPGRMAISYYRELEGSEFLDRIEHWHTQYAWPQNLGKNLKFVGAPAPRDIAEAAFGRRLDDKLRKSTVERLLPCIVDGQQLPRDLVFSTARRATNRVGLDHWEWEKCLGIACALFRGYSTSQGEEYQMALEEERATRDYLYGRLLAVADSIEGFALTKAETNRDTTAARLMQRFADRPFSTWRNIELALTPYKSRLKSSEKGAGFLWKREKLLDEIQCRFQSDDFTDDHALSAEFLLGFHCQRMALRAGTPAANDEKISND
ncbi:MAG: type I-C CRISPR-associated protein Cas8c/Csd1 [Betaproteobacteria bacterium]|nr:type I-C CRISPR-associated protein Cas8c/Csd1 [Betaproteobacteria bacterium]